MNIEQTLNKVDMFKMKIKKIIDQSLYFTYSDLPTVLVKYFTADEFKMEPKNVDILKALDLIKDEILALKSLKGEKRENALLVINSNLKQIKQHADFVKDIIELANRLHLALEAVKKSALSEDHKEKYIRDLSNLILKVRDALTYPARYELVKKEIDLTLNKINF